MLGHRVEQFVVRRVGEPSSSYSDSRFRTAVRTSMPASLIILTSSARDGGVFKYWMTSGSMPLSRNRSSVLREVEQRGCGR